MELYELMSRLYQVSSYHVRAAYLRKGVNGTNLENSPHSLSPERCALCAETKIFEPGYL